MWGGFAGKSTACGKVTVLSLPSLQPWAIDTRALVFRRTLNECYPRLFLNARNGFSTR